MSPRALAIAVLTAAALVGGCSSTDDAQPRPTASDDHHAPSSEHATPPSTEAGETTSTTTAATSTTGTADTAGYLSAARKDTQDDVSDARLLKIGRAFCQDLRAGKWRGTVIDDGGMVDDLSTQMRVNIGFAAVHYLCTDQEAQYLTDAGAALGGN